MRVKIVSVLLMLISKLLYGQEIIKVTLHSTPSSAKLTGFNLNSQTKPSWSNLSFLDSVASLNVVILRYPGGTISQYWDWQNGRALPPDAWGEGGFQNYAYLGTTRMVPDYLTDYKSALQRLKAIPLFVLNVLSRSVTDQMNMLRTAHDLGIEVEFIELGNEMYFTETDFINRFPTAGSYAREMNIWRDSILAIFPQAKIAVIGATTQPETPNGQPTPDRIRYWNDSIYGNYQHLKYITFHNYYNHKTAGMNPNPHQVYANAFAEYDIFQNFSTSTTPNDVKVWFTEYNLNDNTQGQHNVASSWLHGLFTGILFLKHFEDPKIDMAINHQITGSAPFASLDSYSSGDTISNNLTAEGNVMKWLNAASRDHISSSSLDFSINPIINVGNLSFPSLIGRCFMDSTGRKSVVVFNLSEDSIRLDFGSVFNNPTTKHITIITSINKNKLNITTKDLLISTEEGTKDSPLIIPSNGFTYLKEHNEVTLNVFDNNNSKEQWVIFPNPSNSVFTFLFDEIYHQEKFKVELYSEHGGLLTSFVLSKNSQNIDLSSFPSGTYFVKILDGEFSKIKRIIKE